MWFQRFRHGPYPGNECVAQTRSAAVGADGLLEELFHPLHAFFVLDFGEGVLHGVYGVVVREVEFGEIVAFFRLV